MSFKEVKSMKNEVTDTLKEKSNFNPDKRLENKSSEHVEKHHGESRFNPDKRVEKNELKQYYSTVEQRMKEIPKAARFVGKYGESKALPTTEACLRELKKFGLRGITYKNFFPDFRKVSVETVKIDHMTNVKEMNYSNAIRVLAEKWNRQKKDGRTDWKPSEADAWKKKNHLDFHECEDLHTCQFVPHAIHSNYGHTGGRFEAKIRDGGGKFDA